MTRGDEKTIAVGFKMDATGRIVRDKQLPGDYSIGSKHWPGISKLAEEAGEVVQVCGKIIGANGSTQHWDGTNLRTRLEEEMADVMAACWFVLEKNHYDDDFVKERMQRKLELFREWHREGLAALEEAAVAERDEMIKLAQHANEPTS